MLAGADAFAVPPTTFQFHHEITTVREGSSNHVPGTNLACVLVRRDGPADLTQTVEWHIEPLTAQVDEDFTWPLWNRLVFPPGSTFQCVFVALLNDAAVEPSETLRLILKNPAPGAFLGHQSNAVLQIDDNDAGLEFTTNSFVVPEGVGQAIISVHRGDDGTHPVTVDYETRPLLATAGADFIAQSGTLFFPTGRMTATFTVPIIDDCLAETNEALQLRLSRPTGAAALGTNASAVLTILDHGRERPGSRDFSLLNTQAMGIFARQADGKIIVAGHLLIGSSAFQALVRLRADGTLDEAFDASAFVQSFTSRFNFTPRFRALAAQADGRILVAGDGLGIEGANTNFFVRLLPNGQVDPSFQVLLPETSGGGAPPIQPGTVYALALEPDGRIVAGGAFKSINGEPRQGLARLHPDGALDQGFAPAAGVVTALALQPDGRVVANSGSNGIARFNAGGSLDSSFDPGAGAYYETFGWRVPDVLNLALQPDGKVLLVGGFTRVDGVSRNGVARLNADGSLDGSFDPGAGPNLEYGSLARILGVAVQWDGKVIISGVFTNFNGVARQYLARLTSFGGVDTSFDAGNDWGYIGLVQCLIQPDGHVLVNSPLLGVRRLHGEPPLRFISQTRLSDAITRLTLDAQPGLLYYAQSSTNLLNWTLVGTNRATNCTVDFHLPDPVGQPRRFHRAFKAQ
jgi:uncharacterized delta-60 repeat protein